MVTIKRVTREGAMIRVFASDPDQANAIAQMFYFFPDGSQEGPSVNVVPPWAAKAIMSDAGIAHHFECTPRIDKGDPATKEQTGQGKVKGDSKESKV